MALVPRRSQSGPEILISPVWGSALTQALTKLEALSAAAPIHQSTPPGLARESAGAALVRARGVLLAALETEVPSATTASELLDGSAQLLRVIAHLWLTHAEGAFRDRLPVLAGMLERQLSAHEHGVLSGELTYAVSVEQAERSVTRIRQALSELGQRGGTGALISLQIAAIELAGLLVMVAGNVATAGRGDASPEAGAPAVGRALHRVVLEISTYAKVRNKQITEQQDGFGTHLARALRVGAPGAAPGTKDPENLGGLYEAWLQLAVLTRLALGALDAKLPAPVYAGRGERLERVSCDRAAELLAGGRLAFRADRFHHVQAWRAQSARLSYAVELYINGLHGAAGALEDAHAITLNTLVRAIVGATLLDLRRTAGGALAAQESPSRLEHRLRPSSSRRARRGRPETP